MSAFVESSAVLAEDGSVDTMSSTWGEVAGKGNFEAVGEAIAASYATNAVATTQAIS